MADDAHGTNGFPLDPITFDAVKEVMDRGWKIQEEHRAAIALTLFAGGIQLIPDDDLRDHQFIVSRGIYEAMKKACEHPTT